ncbi:uncharacterized protein G2W53_010824 [Senna tora]|uniref:Uncharacterized protein n=1 Tax=Senna tora TaxID=362788 RepID=A0A835CC49_9FABA|nr:uncharacterized protein G2W53_010824 [Senna tora]
MANMDVKMDRLTRSWAGPPWANSKIGWFWA